MKTGPFTVVRKRQPALVRFWHLADKSAASEFVRYWSNSGHTREGLCAENVNHGRPPPDHVGHWHWLGGDATHRGTDDWRYGLIDTAHTDSDPRDLRPDQRLGIIALADEVIE